MKILLAVLLLFASPFAFADDTDEELKQWKADLSKHETELEKVEAEIRRINTETVRFNGELDEIGCKWDGKEVADCENLSGLTKEQKIQFSKALAGKAAALGQIAKLAPEKERLSTVAENLRQQIKARVTPRKPAESIEAFTDLLDIQSGETKLQASWVDVLDEKATLSEALDELEDHMDQTAIGMYFQDKMVQYMNSTLLCRANRRCHSGPENEDVIQDKYIRQLFPKYESGKTGRTGRQSYDKTKVRRPGRGGNQ